MIGCHSFLRANGNQWGSAGIRLTPSGVLFGGLIDVIERTTSRQEKVNLEKWWLCGSIVRNKMFLMEDSKQELVVLSGQHSWQNEQRVRDKV